MNYLIAVFGPFQHLFDPAGLDPLDPVDIAGGVIDQPGSQRFVLFVQTMDRRPDAESPTNLENA